MLRDLPPQVGDGCPLPSELGAAGQEHSIPRFPAEQKRMLQKHHRWLSGHGLPQGPAQAGHQLSPSAVLSSTRNLQRQRDMLSGACQILPSAPLINTGAGVCSGTEASLTWLLVWLLDCIFIRLTEFWFPHLRLCTTCLPGHLVCCIHTYTSGRQHAHVNAVCGHGAFPHPRLGICFHLGSHSLPCFHSQHPAHHLLGMGLLCIARWALGKSKYPAHSPDQIQV